MSSRDDKRGPGHVPPPPLEALGVMLDGYFHQDFRYIYVSPVGAARAFAVEASPEQIAAARSELAAFIEWAGHVPKKSWQAAFTNAGGSWLPGSIAPILPVLQALAPRPGA
ncbi:MAG: contact-dependent growth inhibition system immunity protein [bacterium]